MYKELLSDGSNKRKIYQFAEIVNDSGVCELSLVLEVDNDLIRRFGSDERGQFFSRGFCDAFY